MPWSLPPEPRDIALELVRLERPSDAHAPQSGGVDYALRKGEAVYREARLTWDAEVEDLLAALQAAPPDLAAAQALAARLQVLFDATGWPPGAEQATQLTISAAGDELYALPWELLRPPGPERPSIRKYTLPADRVAVVPPGREALTRPGRVLVAWADAGPVAVKGREHLDAVRRAAACLPDDAVIEAQQVSLSGLERRLTLAAGEERPVRVLHLVCHGQAAVIDDEPCFGLRLADGLVGPRDLAKVLAGFAPSLRLVVLLACHGGDPGRPGSRVGSVAQALHAVGIESVLASRYALSVPGAVALAGHLYERLLGDLASLEQAICTARPVLEAEGKALDALALQLYARGGPERVDTRPITIRPYRGLAAYGAEHARFYFGRDAELALLVGRVEAAEAAPGAHPAIYVVTGPSGCGKSSLVMAGLFPALGAARRTLVLRAGEGRVAQLELAEALDALGTDQALVVLLDQAEELVTRLDLAEAQALVGTLLRAATSRPGRVFAFLTVRLDYLGPMGALPLADGGQPLDRALADQPGAMGEWLLSLSHLGPQQLREIVAHPAAAVGLRFADDLVDQVLADLGETQGSLPLLSYALDQLWAHRRGRELDGETYQELGRVGGALARTAEQWRAGLSGEQADQATRLMRRLVDAGTSTGALVRRRLWLDQVRPADGAQAFDAVVDALIGHRLLVAGARVVEGQADRRWVELAHDALIQAWVELRELALEDRKRARHTQELEEQAGRWLEAQRAGHPESDRLLTGRDLLLAQARVADQDDPVGALVRRFVEASTLRATRRQRRVMGGLVAGSLAVAIAAAVIAVLGVRASHQARLAQDNLRLGLAREALESDPSMAAIWLRETRDLAARPEWAELAAGLDSQAVAALHVEGTHHAAWLDRDRLLVLSVDQRAEVWDVSRGSVVASQDQEWALVQGLLARLRAFVTNLRFDRVAATADGDRIAGLRRTQSRLRIEVVDPRTGERLADAEVERSAGIEPLGGEHHLLWGPDGQWLAVQWSPGVVVLLDGDSLAPRAWLLGPHAFAALWTSPGRDQLFTRDARGLVRAWESESGRSRLLLDLGPDGFLARGPEGELVTLGEHGDAWLHRAAGRGMGVLATTRLAPAWPVERAIPGVAGVVLASAEGQLALADRSGTVHTLEGHEGLLRAAALAPNGWVVSAGSDRVVRAQLAGRAPVDADFEALVDEVVVDPLGRVAAVRMANGRVRQVDLETGTSQALWHPERIGSLAWSPDGAWLLTRDETGEARVWARWQPRPGATGLADLGDLDQAALSPAGRFLAVATVRDEVEVRATADGGATAEAGKRWRAQVPSGVVRLAVLDAEPVALVLDERGAVLRLAPDEAGGEVDAQEVGGWRGASAAGFLGRGRQVWVAQDDGLWLEHLAGSTPQITGQDDLSVVEPAPQGDAVALVREDGSAELWALDRDATMVYEGQARLVAWVGPRTLLLVRSTGGGALITLEAEQDGRLTVRPFDVPATWPGSRRYDWRRPGLVSPRLRRLALEVRRLVGNRAPIGVGVAPGWGLVSYVDGLVVGIPLEQPEATGPLQVERLAEATGAALPLGIVGDRWLALRSTAGVDGAASAASIEIIDRLGEREPLVLDGGLVGAVDDRSGLLRTVTAQGRLVERELPLDRLAADLDARSRACAGWLARQRDLGESSLDAVRRAQDCTRRQGGQP